MESINFDIITERKYFAFNMSRKIKKFFKINYCTKKKGVYTLIDDNNNYIINIYRKGFNFIISDKTEEDIIMKLDKCIDFININFKNTTIGFNQNTGKEIPINKFLGLKLIMLNI